MRLLVVVAKSACKRQTRVCVCVVAFKRQPVMHKVLPSQLCRNNTKHLSHTLLSYNIKQTYDVVLLLCSMFETCTLSPPHQHITISAF